MDDKEFCPALRERPSTSSMILLST